MSKQGKSKKTSDISLWRNPVVIVALLGALGAIIAAVCPFLATYLPIRENREATASAEIRIQQTNIAQTSTPSLPITPTSLPISKTLNISSKQGWQDTGIQVNPGDNLEFLYHFGLWTRSTTDPNDYTKPDNTPLPNDPADKWGCLPMLSSEVGKNAMVGKFSNYPPFRVIFGQNISSNQQGGNLFLRINDCDGSLSDNDGEINITVIIK